MPLPDYHASATLQGVPSFGPYTPPPYIPNFYLPPGVTCPAPESTYLIVPGAELTQQEGGYAVSRPSSAAHKVRQLPHVTSFTREGVPGSVATVFFQSVDDYLAPPTSRFTLRFGETHIPSTLQLIGSLNDSLKRYSLAGQVPDFEQTGSFSFSVPLKLVACLVDGVSKEITIELGLFTYTSPVSTAPPSRKRKASSDSEFESQPAAKRVFNHHLQLQDRSQDGFDNQPSPYSPFLSTPTGGSVYQPGLTRNTSPRPSGHHHSASTASQVSFTAPSPHTPVWSPSFTPVKTEHSPRGPMTPAPRPDSTSSNAVPKLVRTSTIQQSPPSLGSLGSSVNSQAFNPYAMYPLKATLKLSGDLDAVATDWTDDEFAARRRLVEFTRSQSASTINASFKTVAPEERAQNSITISCIWWKEKKECFVTSVDTIYLLEALVGVRFTVEEKNRIRRNLEGFHPLTVSKAKADSEDFFKVIMGFPHPKPRNIEKDVKVFPWKILSHALKKIIGKYSASYSSTASAILTPANSVYASTEASVEYAVSNSSHEELVTAAALPAYSLPAGSGYSPEALQVLSVPVTTGPIGDFRLQMPTMGPQYDIPAHYAFQPVPVMPPHAEARTARALTAGPRMPATWDFATFVNESPASMGPASAPQHYPVTTMGAEYVPAYPLTK